MLSVTGQRQSFFLQKPHASTSTYQQMNCSFLFADRRHDGFYKMEELIPDAEISGTEDDTKGCATLDMTTKQLSAMACDDTAARPVICQYPGLPTDGALLSPHLSLPALILSAPCLSRHLSVFRHLSPSPHSDSDPVPQSVQQS